METLGVSGTSPGTWDLGRSVIFFRKEAGELQMMTQDCVLVLPLTAHLRHSRVFLCPGLPALSVTGSIPSYE